MCERPIDLSPPEEDREKAVSQSVLQDTIAPFRVFRWLSPFGPILRSVDFGMHSAPHPTFVLPQAIWGLQNLAPELLNFCLLNHGSYVTYSKGVKAARALQTLQD